MFLKLALIEQGKQGGCATWFFLWSGLFQHYQQGADIPLRCKLEDVQTPVKIPDCDLAFSVEVSADNFSTSSIEHFEHPVKLAAQISCIGSRIRENMDT